MTKELPCLHLGSAIPLISVPDLETMFKLFSRKPFSSSGYDLDFSYLAKCTQESTKQ